MENTVSELFKYKPLPKYTGLEGPTSVKHKDVYVGIEIEVEQWPLDSMIYKPETILQFDDHSLKIDGMELVTIPIKLRYLEVELNRVLCQVKDDVLLSSRCSTHVHMNVRDMTATQLGNMLLLYMIFERSLYHISGDRWDNNFCVPLHMCHNLVTTWFKNEGYIETWAWKKYTGLNLCPIWGGESTKIGTVEFRQMQGTVDVPRIINWCNLITALKRGAQTIDREEILAHIRIMKTTSGYWWLAKEVFGSWAKMLTNQPTFSEDVEDCITNLKTILWSKPPKVVKKTTKVLSGVSMADANTTTVGPQMTATEILYNYTVDKAKFFYTTPIDINTWMGLVNNEVDVPIPTAPLPPFPEF